MTNIQYKLECKRFKLRQVKTKSIKCVDNTVNFLIFLLEVDIYGYSLTL